MSLVYRKRTVALYKTGSGCSSLRHQAYKNYTDPKQPNCLLHITDTTVLVATVTGATSSLGPLLHVSTRHIFPAFFCCKNTCKIMRNLLSSSPN